MNPFTKLSSEQITDWGEVRLIQQIKETLGSVSPPAPEGMGDDAAVLPPRNPPTSTVITTDGLVWNQHFDDSVAPARAGAKLVKRNLSDLAAMGATPGWMVLNLLLGPNVSKEWILQFTSGIRDACQEYGASLVGGDIAQSDPGSLAGFITAGGSCHRPLLRTGSQPGDSLWVTGVLGGSLQGHHLSFQPRLREGSWLSRRQEVHSCIDVTDGLGKDLPAILPPGAQASLYPERIPIAPAVSTHGDPALKQAFNDGEDYELLFTLAKTVKTETFLQDWTRQFPETPLSHIGFIQSAVSPDPFLTHLEGKPFPVQPGEGFQHLKK